jgi:hypothetical protein
VPPSSRPDNTPPTPPGVHYSEQPTQPTIQYSAPSATVPGFEIRSSARPGFEFDGHTLHPDLRDGTWTSPSPVLPLGAPSPGAQALGRQALGRQAPGAPSLDAPALAGSEPPGLALPGPALPGAPLPTLPRPGSSLPESSPPGPQPTRPARPAGHRADRGRPALQADGGEWARLLRSCAPQPPAERSWFSRFRDGLVFRGWLTRVAIPILAVAIFGVAAVIITGLKGGNTSLTPPATALGFPPATLAGAQFTAAASGRGISQTLNQVASDGADVVAVGSQAGARIPRAQFFFSPNDGRSWTMGTEQTPDGGQPPPGHAARFVAGGHGAWVAVGPGSIWTSADGRTWTLTSSAGMPLRPGDQLNVLRRTASGFLAAGVNIPDGDRAKASPVLFLSANGISWQRLDATQLGLSAGTGRALNIRYAAVSGPLILIAGDVSTTKTSGAWLSRDGGLTWSTAHAPAAAPAGQPQVTGVAAVDGGFVLVRAATVHRSPGVQVYRSADGSTWTRQATLTAPGGLVTGLVNGGPSGAVITGRAGGGAGTLTAYVSATGASWQQTPAFGRADAESVSAVTTAEGRAVVTATMAAPQSREPAISVLAGGAPVLQVNMAKIPGAFDPQLAVNDVVAAGSNQVAVGSANGYPVAWFSADGGSTWVRTAGATPAVFDRPGTEQLTSVTHGPAGWLAVGSVTAGASQHPVVLTSADGRTWQAADGAAAFAGSGLVTEQAAAGPAGYVIVGQQVTATGTRAVAWRSISLTGWQRATVGEFAGSAGSTSMRAVTAGTAGFVAVGSAGNQASAWTSADGLSWHQEHLPGLAGAQRAVLARVASSGRNVVAVGTAVTTTGRRLPFALGSANGALTWTESVLPEPDGQASVTAVTSAGDTFTVAGTFGPDLGHQDVVVWTSVNGSAWMVATPTGQGLTGPGVQEITALSTSGSEMIGVGFTATLTGEQPVFWQAPVR